MTAIKNLVVARNAICFGLAAFAVTVWMALGIVSANVALSSAERAEVIVEVA